MEYQVIALKYKARAALYRWLLALTYLTTITCGLVWAESPSLAALVGATSIMLLIRGLNVVSKLQVEYIDKHREFTEMMRGH